MTKPARVSALLSTVGREEWTAGLLVLHLEGPLRAPVGGDLGSRVEALLARGRRRILLDLANVTDLDAAGLGELVRVRTLAGASRGELWIRNTSGRIRELLDRAGLFELLSFRALFAYERCS